MNFSDKVYKYLLGHPYEVDGIKNKTPWRKEARFKKEAKYYQRQINLVERLR